MNELVDNDPTIPTRTSTDGVPILINRNYTGRFTQEMHMCPKPSKYEETLNTGMPRNWHKGLRNIRTAKHKMPRPPDDANHQHTYSVTTEQITTHVSIGRSAVQ